MSLDITQEMVDQANSEESALLAQSPAVLMAQNQHLNNRVLLLRALANEQAKALAEKDEEIKKLKARRKPQDRRPKSSVAPPQ